MRDAHDEAKFKSKDFRYVQKSEKPFSYDDLNDWLQNGRAIVARTVDVKLNSSKYTAHTSKQEGCTDMARRGVPSWRIEMTGRGSSKKQQKIHIEIDWRDVAKLGGFSVSTPIGSA